ncbi:gamma-glutamyl-gamma-aminobutyrate hydrolase family protein [Robbsia andropogonis]|nr:gamma-glutamyl-gamma-aminobutyrate hydrolase family protein [Robbsia andropogonis]MCP1121523.1 gamma-glutamyl-gamma-aminobutyrate hydrolase family protein [Robbsia andropogonis]MCP1131342.1 gamma-glutamyl-gamma-aminobutyrate hydrolase family protein [Robbsia andropogonis]
MKEYFDASLAVVGVSANRHLHDGVHRDWLRRRYIEALERYSSVECVILPTIDGDLSRDGTLRKFREVMRRLDGLVLTGDESDLDPDIFDNELAWHRSVDDVIPGKRDRPRDRLSSVALSVAIEFDMPILGICRGLQEMSVHCGGNLHSDLSVFSQSVSHSEPSDVPRDQQYLPTHTVSVMPVGRLSPIVESAELYVNSLHNQGIKTLGANVQMEAVASDGVIEAISYKKSSTFQLAVQWHPEWHATSDVTSRKLFKAFGNACLDYQSTKLPHKRPNDSNQ